MVIHQVPIEVSARHIHLSQADVEILFGAGYKLTPARAISQPHQYATEETLKAVGPKNEFPAIRIVGPVREETQVELSLTDGYRLGIHPPVIVSGQLERSIGGLTLVGPVGKLALTRGVIVAQRHLHIAVTQAKEWGIHHLEIVSLKIAGSRSLIFHDVVVRSRAGIDELAVHLDTDEANAAGVKQGDTAELIVK